MNKKILSFSLVSLLTLVGLGLGLAPKNMESVKADWSIANDTFIAATNSKPNSDTMRIFVHNGYAGQWQSSGALTWIRTWDESGHGTVYETKWVGENDVYLGYADVEINIAGIQILRVNPNDKTIVWNNLPDILGSDISNAKFYSIGEYKNNDGSTDWWNDELVLDEIGPNFAVAIMEGLTTCSDASNGYGNFDALNDKFFSKFTEEAKQATLLDYDYNEYKENDFSYDGIEKNTTSVTVQEKINQMQLMAGKVNAAGINLTTNSDTTNTIVIITSVSVSAVFVLSLYFILRKRRIIQK